MGTPNMPNAATAEAATIAAGIPAAGMMTMHSSAPAPAPAPPSGTDQARKAQPKGKYVVQVASYQSKGEAEAVRERLTDAGFPAYIVEGVIKEKGTMYRVRIGRHLELSTAEELAAKAGKNAIAVLE